MTIRAVRRLRQVVQGDTHRRGPAQRNERGRCLRGSVTEQAIGDVHVDGGAGDQTDEIGADPVQHPDDRGASQRRSRAQLAGEPSDPVLFVTDDQVRH